MMQLIITRAPARALTLYEEVLPQTGTAEALAGNAADTTTATGILFGSPDDSFAAPYVVDPKRPFIPDTGSADELEFTYLQEDGTYITFEDAPAAFLPSIGSGDELPQSTAVPLAGNATASTTATGAVTTGIQLAAATTAVTVLAASITTGIDLTGAMSDVSTAVGALLTAIQLDAAASDTTTGSGTLAGGALFSADATMSTTLAGNLTTGIQLAAAVTAVTTAVGALLTQILAAGAATDSSSGAASLTTQILAAGAASDTSMGSGSISTQIELVSAALAVTTAAASLLTKIQLAAAATMSTVGSASLSTGGDIAANATDASTGSGTLSTQIKLLGAATLASTAIAALSTRIELAGAALAQSAASATFSPPVPLAGGATDDTNALAPLTYAGSAILLADFILELEVDKGLSELQPIGFFFQRAGDALRYGIDFTPWLAQRWLPRQQVSYGDVVRSTRRSSVQFRCVVPGITGSNEPRWPGGLCVQLLDGNAIWQTERIDDSSLVATIAPTSATWSSSSPLISVSNAIIFDGRIALATVNSSNAVPGNDYDVVCAVVASDTRQRAAKIRIKVR
jgi:hypothetical protein